MFLVDQSVEITKVFILYLRRRTCEFVLFRVLMGARVEVRPQQASVLACVCSYRNK